MATVPIRVLPRPVAIRPVPLRTTRSRVNSRAPASSRQPVHPVSNPRHSRIYNDRRRSKAVPNLLIQVLPTRDNQEAISTVLPISMDKVSQANTRLGSKVNIHPLADQCIPRTDHQNPEKDDQLLRHRDPLHRQLAIRTEGTVAVRTLRHHSSDRTVSNRHRAVPVRRRHPRLVHRVLPVSHRLAVHPDSNRRQRRARGIQRPRSNHHNRTTTGPISLINRGDIQTLKRINSRIRRTSSDRRCIPVDGRAVQVSTAVNILPRDPSNSGELTTDHGPVVRREPLPAHPEHQEPRTNGMRNPIGTRRISNHPIRLINRPNNSRGTRCHPHRKVHL